MASEISIVKPEVKPLEILQNAIDKGASIEQITALMGLAERWEVNQDKKRFREAMTAFSNNAPKIDKNQHVKFQTQKGVTEYDHATLDNVTEQIVAELSKVGITHAHRVTQQGSIITVACVLGLGVYSEETSITAGADESGGKNGIQAIVSTITYLRRHTLLAATGTATGIADDDGAASSITDDDLKAIELISKATSLEELKPMYEVAMKAAIDSGNATLVQKLAMAKKTRKAELSHAKNS